MCLVFCRNVCKQETQCNVCRCNIVSLTEVNLNDIINGMESEQTTLRYSLGEGLKGRPVAVADLRGFGETATSRHSFYRTSNADEEIAVLYYALGDSLVSRRAEDLLLVARHVSEALGGVPDLLAEGRAAIPAVHAHFLERDAFGGIEIYRAPLGWSALLEDDTASYPFANCVQGALHEYDWMDLLDFR